MKKYIAKKSLGIDELTGLERQLRATDVFINAETELITVILKEVLVSPTDVVMKELLVTQFTRFNSSENKRFDQLEASPIGLGIEQMLLIDLENYPDIQQA